MLPPIVGVSQSIERIRDLIHHVADTGLNVVISGETGVGKEVVALNLHKNSPRVGKPFVKVNCAALPEGLLESELYGYERGAFTGAERKRRGKFELAHGGVLFLDEIGDMSISLQSKLLHVLQSGEFAPLGSEKELKINTWVIAATNHDLEKEIQNKQFREDLYYRLNIIKINIPPLRNRPEDIPPLIEYYTDIYTEMFKNKNVVKPDREIIEKLSAYHWPGNVRQLQNVLKRTLVLGNWDEIIEELPGGGSNTVPAAQTGSGPEVSSIIREHLGIGTDKPVDFSDFSLKSVKKKAMDSVEKEIISYVLKETGWNRSKASKILKISYKTLLYKISDLNLEPPKKFEL